MNDEKKLIVFNILKNIGFVSKKNNNGLKSARMKDALYNLPKAIAKIQYPTLPAIENLSDDLHGGVKIIIPSIYTRLEIILGLNLFGHTNTLTEASNLLDERYKRGEIQNEQQCQNALNKFHI